MGLEEDGSVTRQLISRSDKHCDWQLIGTTCKVIQSVYDKKVLLTLSESMWSTFWIRVHEQGWLSTLK